MTESEFLLRPISTDAKDAVVEANGGSATEKAAEGDHAEEGAALKRGRAQMQVRAPQCRCRRHRARHGGRLCQRRKQGS